MHYGFGPHTPSEDDRTMIACGKCGWISTEMTAEELGQYGVPRYCGNASCDGIAAWFATYAPHEKEEALRFLRQNVG
jgi:hypothetical protein